MSHFLIQPYQNASIIGAEHEVPVSIIIRALNEERYLPDCLRAIRQQRYQGDIEIILVDSGSVDSTVEIAKTNGCNVLYIPKEEFSYGGALNYGISKARYDYIVVLSAHCVPDSPDWLSELLAPIRQGLAQMVYGPHRADPEARSSEINYFVEKFSQSRGLQSSPRLNNGNSAFLKELWKVRPFDEKLSAQEDVEFSSWHINNGARLYFVPSARVVHYHNDRNKTLYRRIYNEVLVEFQLGIRKLGWVPYKILLLPIRITKDLALAYRRNGMIRAFRGVVYFRLVEIGAYLAASSKYINVALEGKRRILKMK